MSVGADLLSTMSARTDVRGYGSWGERERPGGGFGILLALDSKVDLSTTSLPVKDSAHMSAKANYFKLGLFILGAFLLGIVALLVLGAARFFEKKVVIETYLDQTV